MSAPQPPKLTGPTNELAKERNRGAAERTINAWIGQCLSLISIGVAIDQIFLSLRQRLPEVDLLTTATATRITSKAFIGCGVLLLGIALVQHRVVIKALGQADYIWLSVNHLNRIAIAAILIFSGLGLFAVLFLL